MRCSVVRVVVLECSFCRRQFGCVDEGIFCIEYLAVVKLWWQKLYDGIIALLFGVVQW